MTDSSSVALYALGKADVEIDVMRRSWSSWLKNQNWRKPGTRTSTEIKPDSHIDVNPSSSAHSGTEIIKDFELKRQMDLDLYWAAKKNGEDFTVVLNRFTREKGLILSVVFDQVSPIGNTYLHVAASFNNEAVVSYIANHSPQLVTKTNFTGDTALHLAARAGHTSIVNRLLTLQQDNVNSASSEGQDEGQAEQEILERTKNEKGNTALHEAVMNSHAEIAYGLIQADPQVAFYLNNEEESPLYLAAKAGSVECVSLILFFQKEYRSMFEQVKNGKSPVHAAISSRNRDVLELLLIKAPEFMQIMDEGRFPLHYAASMGYLEEVQYILNHFPSKFNEKDNGGLLPIHWASAKGHVSIIKELLIHWPEPVELRDRDGANILHFAAKSGKCNVIRYLLKDRTFEELINMKDKHGNTPLHLATMHWQPRIVSTLTWDSRVNLTAVNDRGMTAIDAAEYHMDKAPSFQQRLTWIALRAADVPRAFPRQFLNADSETSEAREEMTTTNSIKYKDRVNTLLVVSTLIATITFAAGFTMPGGYSSKSDPNPGMATMLGEKKFHVFILCDTIAMFSSILVAVSLLWAQLGDLNLVLVALRLALPLLGIALGMMALAFTVGVSVVISKLKWLDGAIMTMGVNFFLMMLVLFFPLCSPSRSKYRLLRHIYYYPFRLLLWVTTTDHEVQEG